MTQETSNNASYDKYNNNKQQSFYSLFQENPGQPVPENNCWCHFCISVAPSWLLKLSHSCLSLYDHHQLACRLAASHTDESNRTQHIHPNIFCCTPFLPQPSQFSLASNWPTGLQIPRLGLGKNTKESYQTCYFTKKIAIQGTSTPSKFIHTKI